MSLNLEIVLEREPSALQKFLNKKEMKDVEKKQSMKKHRYNADRRPCTRTQV